jgi:hypothetical protein
VAEIPGFCEALPPASGSSPRTHSPILLEPSRSWHQAVNWCRSDARLPGCTPVAGQGPHERHTLRALDGLRISEALGADIDALGLERGHGTLSGCPDGPADFCGLPDLFPAQPVPSSVAIGPDGYYNVGELKGCPAPTRASRIWRVAPDASTAECGSSPDCVRVFDRGFTSIIDLTFGPAAKSNSPTSIPRHPLRRGAAHPLVSTPTAKKGRGAGFRPRARLRTPGNNQEVVAAPRQLVDIKQALACWG